MPNKDKLSRNLPLGLAALCLSSGLLLLITSFLPYPNLKAILDLAARDGSLESFSPLLYQRLIPILRWSGLALIGLGTASIFLRHMLRIWSVRLIRSIASYSLRDDLSQIFRALQPSKDERFYLLVLAGITLLAAAIRGLTLFAPMLHDEAYTYIAFAARPLRYAMSDYHLPNNHIFHTLLVIFSTRILGNHPWTVRLPAYLAGVLTVPAAYGVGWLVYNRATGLIGAALAAVFSALINYSTNARGYALIALFTLFAVMLGEYLKRHPSPFAWGALILVSTLGFYTIPIMLYPFGMVVIWLLLSMIAKDINQQESWKFLGKLVFSGLAVLLLTVLLYSPVILIGTGWDSLAGNNFVSSLSWGDFLESIPGRASSAWELWMKDVPRFAILVSIIGFAFATALHRRISSHKVPLQIAALLWIGGALAMQRVAPLARIWLFLLPLYLVWSAAGWVGLFSLLPIKIQETSRRLLLAVLVLALPAWHLYATAAAYRPPVQNQGLEEQIAVYLEDQLQAGDTVAADAPLRAMLEYYFTAYGISRDFFYEGEKPYRRAWVVVGEKYGQTLDEVLDREGLAGDVALNSAQIAAHFDRATVYRFDSK